MVTDPENPGWLAEPAAAPGNRAWAGHVYGRVAGLDEPAHGVLFAPMPEGQEYAWGRPPAGGLQQANGRVWEAWRHELFHEPDAVPGEKEQRRYYVAGRRPLDAFVVGGMYRKDRSTWREHRHFIANDGANRGFFSDGPREDTREGLEQYQYMDEKKYDAEIIDEAIARVEKDRAMGHVLAQKRYAEILEEKQNHPEYEGELFISPDAFSASVEDDYSLIGLNCQKYIKLVLREAKKIAKEWNRSLIVE